MKICLVQKYHISMQIGVLQQLKDIRMKSTYIMLFSWNHKYEFILCKKSIITILRYIDVGYLLNPYKARFQIRYMFTCSDITILL